MTANRRQLLQFAAGVLAVPTVSPSSAAGRYPSRPVRLLVPYAAGGPVDMLARLAGQALSVQLGKAFYVENVGGAGGNIGIAQAARSAADGYTVLVVPPNIVVNPAMYDVVSYDPYRDFQPVTVAVTSPTVLTVNPSVEARSVKELVALIKANPPKYSYASPGTGTPPHLIGEHFRLSLGVDLVHVPFNGAGPAVASTLAGHTPIAFSALPPAVSHIQTGKLRALAVTSTARGRALPDVPSMAEAGYPQISGEAWFAFVVPAGTPSDIVTLLYREIVKTLASSDVREKLDTLGFEVAALTPDASVALFRSEGAKWAKVIRDAGVKAE